LYFRFDNIIDLFAAPLPLPVVSAASEDRQKSLWFSIAGPPAKKSAAKNDLFN